MAMRIGEQDSTNEIVASVRAIISLVESCSPNPLLSYPLRHGTRDG